MAFNWQTFRTRTLTAAVFVVVMLAGLLWNHWSFLVLFSVIHFGCWWEYLKLMEKIHVTSFHIYTKFGFMLLGFGGMLLFCGPVYQIAGYGLKENFSLPVSLAGIVLLITGIFQKMRVDLKSFAAAALGLLYISLSWGLMMDLRSAEALSYNSEGGEFFKNDLGYLIPMLIIFSIWINDTMAYIVGSLIGKTPLTKVSPKKTWEGTIGGAILSIITITFFLQSLLYWKYLLGISFISSLIGTFGDLLESKLKRMAGVKDSGHIMPGHGGFLDRFDSLLLATPFVWFYVKLFMS
jgi:phosphatidate cytidylyltransferase